MKVNLACVILIVSLTCPRISSADGNDPLRPLRTTKPPVIDGKIDDPVWKEAPFVTGFKTFVPDFGLDMVEKTEVWNILDWLVKYLPRVEASIRGCQSDSAQARNRAGEVKNVLENIMRQQTARHLQENETKEIEV